MKIENLSDGTCKLTSETGVVDQRNGKVYSEVIVDKDMVKYFTDANQQPETTEKKSKSKK